MLLLTRVSPGDSYVAAVLPAVLVFGAGLTLVVAPVTATVLAAADPRRSGIASGINNAVARVGGLLAVAVLPLIAGLSGSDLLDAGAMESGFQTAMYATTALSVAGGALAWLTIDRDVLETVPAPGGGSPEHAATDRICPVAGPPMRPAREADCLPVEVAVAGGPAQASTER
jgi:hypothetical protein